MSDAPKALKHNLLSDDEEISFDLNFPRPKISLLQRILPPYASSSSDTVFGIEYYGNKHYDKWWFKATIGAYRNIVLKNIDRVYWWIRYRTFSRYHIVNTGLSPRYYDVDELMFHACFSLLGRFVEGELGIIPTNYPHEHYRGYRLHCEGGTDEAAIDLWLWYRFELKKLEDQLESDYRGFVDKNGFDYIDKLKEQKLSELMKIRTTLWT